MQPLRKIPPKLSTLTLNAAELHKIEVIVDYYH
jgi:hypothetical protein